MEVQNYGKIVYVIQINIYVYGKNRIVCKCQDTIQRLGEFFEDNFCKIRQWNVSEHMFIICSIRSDKLFAQELVTTGSTLKSP